MSFLICEDNNSVYLEKDFQEEIWDWSGHYNNIQPYFEEYKHPMWKDVAPCADGHDEIDVMVFDDFFNALDKGLPMPIDVYDMAAWMCISVLSEQSMATGQSVAFPDFTDGKWILRKNTFGT